MMMDEDVWGAFQTSSLDDLSKKEGIGMINDHHLTNEVINQLHPDFLDKEIK